MKFSFVLERDVKTRGGMWWFGVLEEMRSGSRLRWTVTTWIDWRQISWSIDLLPLSAIHITAALVS